MNDQILRRRLDTLGENLQTALETMKHLEGQLKELGISRERRKGLSEAFTDIAEGELNTLNRTLRELDRLDDRSAWKKYGELCDESAQTSQIYREFLEAMLGLVIRQKKMDNKICEVADELIRGICKFGETLTIPASQEAYSRTLARLIRVRFPEWTIWSLPLTAHEFGHVVIEEDDKLGPFGIAEAEAEVASNPELAEFKLKKEESKNKLGTLPTSETMQETEKWKKKLDAFSYNARCRSHDLLADAFGVYALGPCYAASLIVLRLYPLSTNSDDRRAPDAERAALVLEILRKMNDVPESPYTDYINKLSELWAGMMTRSGATPILASRRTFITGLADRIWEQFDQRLFPVKYAISSKIGRGWNVARRWYDFWLNARNKNKLPLPESLTSKSSLRDALNAGWQYRLFADPSELEGVAVATRALCDEILKLRKTQDLTEAKEWESRQRGGSPPFLDPSIS